MQSQTKIFFQNGPGAGLKLCNKKKKCRLDSRCTGPLLSVLQKEHPFPLPATKWASLWFNPRLLLNSLKLNSLIAIGKKLSPQKRRKFILILSVPEGILIEFSKFTILRSSLTLILIPINLCPLKIFLISREPFRNRFKKLLREIEDPSVGLLLNVLLCKL